MCTLRVGTGEESVGQTFLLSAHAQSLRAAAVMSHCGAPQKLTLVSDLSAHPVPSPFHTPTPCSENHNYFPVISQQLAWTKVTVYDPSPSGTYLSPVPKEVFHPTTFPDSLQNLVMKHGFPPTTTVCCVGINHSVNSEPVVGESGFLPGDHV